MAYAVDSGSGSRSRTGRRVLSADEVTRTRDRFARFAWYLDSVLRIPGTSIRIGIEPLLALIPGIGDLLGKTVSVYLVYQAWRLGVPASGIIRMIANLAVDTALGLVPIAGNIGDVFWRANRMNLTILDAHLGRITTDSTG